MKNIYNINNKNESEFLMEILKIIDESEYVEFNCFIKLITSKRLLTYYKRNRVIINKYIDNHNTLYFYSFYRT